MASIGGVTCTFVRGTVPAIREEAEVFRRPGIDGYGIHLTGKGDGLAPLTAVLYSTDAGCDTWAASLFGLQGSLVTVVNDHGDTVTSVFLRRVGNLVKTAAVAPGGITMRGQIDIEAMATQ